jgi:hypothetical protein
MARKRKKLKGLDYNSKEYWNRLLNQDGLSVDSGRSGNLLYVGGTMDIERLSGVLSTRTGRTMPKPTDGGVGDDKE